MSVLTGPTTPTRDLCGSSILQIFFRILTPGAVCDASSAESVSVAEAISTPPSLSQFGGAFPYYDKIPVLDYPRVLML